MTNYQELAANTLYLLALINPVSKVLILTMLPKETDEATIARVSLRASGIGLLILLSLVVAGNFILTDIFHVQIYSLQVAGGLVLLYIGFNALTRGVFFEVDAKESIADISVVPLASPLIAGPGTITAAITFAAQFSLPLTCLAVFFAVLINLIIMLASRKLGSYLLGHHIMGPLIRITGLIVATIAVQMILTGIRDSHAFG
jgi:multiple antibiotic resistance protein